MQELMFEKMVPIDQAEMNTADIDTISYIYT